MPTCPLEPTADYVVLKPAPIQRSGKVILITELEALPRGSVVAVGPWVDDLPLGSIVLTRKYACTTVIVGNDEWWLVNSDDLLCRLEA